MEYLTDERLAALLGQKVLVFCVNYIYTGTLDLVTENDILLKNASIVYETGAFEDPHFKDAQPIGDWYVRTQSIESYGKTLKT